MGFRLISNFVQVTNAIEKSLPKQCLRACHEVRNEWVQSLTGPRHGRLYRIPDSNAPTLTGKRYRAARRKDRMVAGYYRASAAGEAPARRVGDLVRSIRVMPRFEPGRVQARVGSLLDYSLYLEYGTENMSARPSLGPAKDRAMPKVLSIFAEGLI